MSSKRANSVSAPVDTAERRATLNVCVARDKQIQKEQEKGELDTSVKDLGEDDTQVDQSGWNKIHGIRTMKQWKTQSPMFVEVKVEGVPIQMELDTGAAVSMLPWGMYNEKLRHNPLKETAARL